MEKEEIEEIDTTPIPLPTNDLIEEEVNKLLEEEYKIPLNKEDKKNRKNDEIEIELENLNEIDDIIESNYKGNSEKDIKDIITQDKEIKDLLNQFGKQIDQEIEDELIKTYKPHFDEEDVKRAEKLLTEDELIKEAVDKNIISKEEVILFIDYYEIFSLINKSRKFTLQELKNIEKLTKGNKHLKKKDNDNEEDEEDEDEEEEEEEEEENDNTNNEEDAIKKLTSEIESKLNVQESILSNRFDYDKLLFHKGEFLTEIDSRKKTNNNNNNEIMSKSQTSFKNKEKDTSQTSSKTNKEVLNNKNNFSIEELMQVPKYTHSNFNKNIKKNPVVSVRNKIKTPKIQKIELFDDNANPTNLSKVRSNRRELIKLNGKYKGSINKELFKFNPKMTREENQRLREQFIQMYDIPKQYIENQKIDPLRKSSIRKKIEDAQNYYKNKK